jgi:Protein kinase domain
MAARVRLIEKKAGGAFGSIWKAEDEFGRTVAVKIISASRVGESSAIEHAQALARVQHPNVVQVYYLDRLVVPDTGLESDAIVMEWLDGETWHKRCQRAMTEEAAKRLGEDVLDALEAMHAAGIAHRDLHGDNVMVVHGAAKVIDPFYRAADTLALMSTTPREKRLREDYRDVVDRLCEALSASGNTRVADFRHDAMDAMQFADVRRRFVEAFAQPRQRPRRQLVELLADIQTGEKPLADVIARVLDLAEALGDEVLRRFCERELAGTANDPFSKGDKHPEFPYHRVYDAFITASVEINPLAMQWGGNTAAVFQHMEKDSENFFKRKFLEGRPIGILERKARAVSEKTFLVHRKLRLGDYEPDAAEPDAVVHAYERPNEEGRIVEATRARLASYLSAHLRHSASSASTVDVPATNSVPAASAVPAADPAHVELDRALYKRIAELLSPEYISFMRVNNFAGFSFPGSKIKAGDRFLSLSEQVENEFLDNDLEALKLELVEAIRHFDRVLTPNVFVKADLGDEFSYSVPEEWEVDQPDRFREVVEQIHAATTAVVEKHTAFVRAARRKLAV